MHLLYSLLIIYLCFANNCLVSLDLSALDTGVCSQVDGRTGPTTLNATEKVRRVG
jgi:hypothetical protein